MSLGSSEADLKKGVRKMLFKSSNSDCIDHSPSTDIGKFGIESVSFVSQTVVNVKGCDTVAKKGKAVVSDIGEVTQQLDNCQFMDSICSMPKVFDGDCVAIAGPIFVGPQNNSCEAQSSKMDCPLLPFVKLLILLISSLGLLLISLRIYLKHFVPVLMALSVQQLHSLTYRFMVFVIGNAFCAVGNPLNLICVMLMRYLVVRMILFLYLLFLPVVMNLLLKGDQNVCLLMLIWRWLLSNPAENYDGFMLELSWSGIATVS